MTTPLGKGITTNRMTSTEKPSQISLPTTEIGGSVKYSMGITNPFRTNKENWTDPTIQPTIVHFNQSTVPVHRDRNHSTFGSLDSSTDVPRSRRNIDNRTGMNPQGPIVTMIPEYNRSNNSNIFISVSRTSDLAYRGSPYYGTIISEIKNLRGNKILENAERENNFKVEKVRRKNSVIWDHKYSDLIHVDPNHIESDQPVPKNSTNIG